MGKIYTEEQKIWLKDNINNYTYPELSVIFNNKFNTNISAHSLKMLCLRNNIRKENSTHEENPIGHEFVNENGTVFVKVRNLEDFDDDVIKGYRNRAKRFCYETKQRVIWKNHYGEIPDGCHIIFLNGNNRDYRIENLYCIKEKYLPYMNRNHWFSNDPNITLTAIKWCELMYATQE